MFCWNGSAGGAGGIALAGTFCCPKPASAASRAPASCGTDTGAGAGAVLCKLVCPPKPDAAVETFGGLPGGVYVSGGTQSDEARMGSKPGEHGRRILLFLGLFSCCLKPASISGGNVCPRSQISSSFEIFSFWFSGADWTRSVIKAGNTSAIFCTPEANVPGAAFLETAWPAFLARSNHWRDIESTTYSTPSLCVAGLFLNCWTIFWTTVASD